MNGSQVYSRGKGYVALAIEHAREFNFEDVKDTTSHVSQRSLRVLRGIALDKKKQVLIILAFFVLAWTVSLSAMRGKSHAYNRLKFSKLVAEIEGVEEACSVSKEGFETVRSLEKLLCHESPACGVDHDLSLRDCDAYWDRTLQVSRNKHANTNTPLLLRPPLSSVFRREK